MKPQWRESFWEVVRMGQGRTVWGRLGTDSWRQAAVSRNRLGMSSHTFRFFAANRREDPFELWHDKNKCAAIEQSIGKISAVLDADGFCIKDFFAVESEFLAMLFTLR